MRFNATFTARVISWRSVTHVFSGFLTPVLTPLSFQRRYLLFIHSSAEVKGENKKKKVHLNRVSNSRPPGHESNTLTTEPPERSPYFEKMVNRKHFRPQSACSEIILNNCDTVNKVNKYDISETTKCL